MKFSLQIGMIDEKCIWNNCICTSVNEFLNFMLRTTYKLLLIIYDGLYELIRLKIKLYLMGVNNDVAWIDICYSGPNRTWIYLNRRKKGTHTAI